MSDAVTLRARRLAAEVAHLLETGNIPDTDAREPNRPGPEEGSPRQQDGAAADDYYGNEPPRDESGWWE